jgi:hypothetical protein
MPAIPQKEATQRILNEVRELQTYDLVEAFNELRPDSPKSSADPAVNKDDLIRVISSQINAGLEVEELVDLWNVVFPEDRNVWYDEEADALHVNEEPEHAET